MIRECFAICLPISGEFDTIEGHEAESLIVETPSRPDLTAHRTAITADFPTVVAGLKIILGKKLTAYICGAKDVRAVDRWMAGIAPYGDAENRLRFAYRISKALNGEDHPRVIQAWLTGLNPELGDRVPIRLMRDGDLEEVGSQILAAAKAFLAGP